MMLLYPVSSVTATGVRIEITRRADSAAGANSTLVRCTSAAHATSAGSNKSVRARSLPLRIPQASRPAAGAEYGRFTACVPEGGSELLQQRLDRVVEVLDPGVVRRVDTVAVVPQVETVPVANAVGLGAVGDLDD